MLRSVITWSVVTLLVGAVAACPVAAACQTMNCAMTQMGQSPLDDCCANTSHPSKCPQHQSSNDCPYQVVEKTLAAKISSHLVDPAVVGSSADESGVLVETEEFLPVRQFLPDGSGLHLRLCTLLI